MSLPQLDKHFYRQPQEERNHAMMMVRYILDRGIKVTIPGIGPVRNDVASGVGRADNVFDVETFLARERVGGGQHGGGHHDHRGGHGGPSEDAGTPEAAGGSL